MKVTITITVDIHGKADDKVKDPEGLVNDDGREITIEDAIDYVAGAAFVQVEGLGDDFGIKHGGADYKVVLS